MYFVQDHLQFSQLSSEMMQNDTRWLQSLSFATNALMASVCTIMLLPGHCSFLFSSFIASNRAEDKLSTSKIHLQ